MYRLGFLYMIGAIGSITMYGMNTDLAIVLSPQVGYQLTTKDLNSKYKYETTDPNNGSNMLQNFFLIQRPLQNTLEKTFLS